MTVLLDETAAQTAMSVAGGEVLVAEAGDGPPLLILHHEIGSPGWLPFYDALARSFRVLVPDLPGYGSSTRPDWARHPRDLAVILQLLLDELDIAELDLVGLGFGGWVAAEMATMSQRRFRRLVLVNPYGLKPSEGEILDQFVVSHEEFVQSGFADAAAFERVFRALPSVDQLESWDIHREMTTRIAWKPYMFSLALAPLLASVRTPTLVVAGSKDQIAPPECARRYVDCMPEARLLTLDGAGHFADMEQPEELAAAIDSFMRDGS